MSGVPEREGFGHHGREDLVDRRKGAYDNIDAPPANLLKEHATPHEQAQRGAAFMPATEPLDESVPEGLKRERKGAYSPTRGRGEKVPAHVPQGKRG